MNVQQCNFAATCRRAKVVNGSMLVAGCREVSGEGQDAVLDLNEHVSNVEGNLLCTPSAGGFVGTCSKARIVRQSVLSANCLDTAGDRSPTALDLNECVANIDGSLQWCGLDSGG
jgi:hypothetical protein